MTMGQLLGCSIQDQQSRAVTRDNGLRRDQGWIERKIELGESASAHSIHDGS